MPEFKQYIQILTDSCKDAIQQMTNITVGNILVEAATSKGESYPIAHRMAYYDSEEKIDGDFVLAFGNETTATMLASGIGEQMGLDPFVEFNDDVVDLLNEFLNVVVGNAISEWDSLGFSVSFETPVMKKDVVLKDVSISKVFKITIGIKSKQIQGDEPQQNLVLYVTFTKKVDNVLQNMRILVAEDSRVIRSIISKILINEGCDVKTAEDGEKAISIYDTFRPDLTLMDINMPKMSGFEAISRIRKNNSKAKFVILSSSSKKDEVLTAKSLGVIGYLIKPIKPEVLVEKLKGILEK